MFPDTARATPEGELAFNSSPPGEGSKAKGGYRSACPSPEDHSGRRVVWDCNSEEVDVEEEAIEEDYTPQYSSSSHKRSLPGVIKFNYREDWKRRHPEQKPATKVVPNVSELGGQEEAGTPPPRKRAKVEQARTYNTTAVLNNFETGKRTTMKMASRRPRWSVDSPGSDLEVPPGFGELPPEVFIMVCNPSSLVFSSSDSCCSDCGELASAMRAPPEPRHQGDSGFPNIQVRFVLHVLSHTG